MGSWKATDAPKSLAKAMQMGHYKDANLQHDLSTGQTVAGILHLLNQTPADWYSKQQITVEHSRIWIRFYCSKDCS
jgi:hypothetical protein